MEILQDSKDIISNKSFLSHVFSTSTESKAEIFNIIQYATLAIIPVVTLNKLVQRFIPEADPEKSSLELLIEVFVQLIVMFCGIVLIHRVITYFPTYSGFKYESLTLTNVILAFLVIVLSIQTKLGIKVNIIVDRINNLWNGSDYYDEKINVRNKVRVSNSLLGHSPSQADYLDNPNVQSNIFPPAPIATSSKPQNDSYDNGLRPASVAHLFNQGPMAANSVLGGSFGSFF